MSAREKQQTIDDLWEIAHRPGHQTRRFALIEGEIVEMHPPGREHGVLALRLGSRMLVYVTNHDLGEVTIETAYYDPADPGNAITPDIAFTHKDRLPDAAIKGYVPQMPDLLVEIKSPSNTKAELRRKAEYALKRGARLAWLVYPESQSVDVCTLDQAANLHIDTLTHSDDLTGGDVLPGFRFPLDELFLSA